MTRSSTERRRDPPGSLPPPAGHPLAALLSALVGLAGPLLAFALVVRLLLWPAREMGGLFMWIVYVVVVPAQLLPALGLLFARRLARGWSPAPLGWLGLLAWACAGSVTLLVGLAALLLRD